MVASIVAAIRASAERASTGAGARSPARVGATSAATKTSLPASCADQVAGRAARARRRWRRPRPRAVRAPARRAARAARPAARAPAAAPPAAAARLGRERGQPRGERRQRHQRRAHVSRAQTCSRSRGPCAAAARAARAPRACRAARRTCTSTVRSSPSKSKPQTRLQQHRARERDAGVRGQLQQQRELARLEPDVGTVDARLAGRLVDLEPVEAQHQRTAVARQPGPPPDRLDPRDELARRERLGHVVVGADLQPDDAVDLIGPRGQHQDRQLAPLAPQRAHDLEAVDHRQAEVEDQQVGPGARRAQRGRPVRRLLAAEPLPPQVVHHQLADGRVVLRHHDPREPPYRGGARRAAHQSCPPARREPLR